VAVQNGSTLIDGGQLEDTPIGVLFVLTAHFPAETQPASQAERQLFTLLPPGSIKITAKDRCVTPFPSSVYRSGAPSSPEAASGTFWAAGFLCI
jgi:hypothetical protein